MSSNLFISSHPDDIEISAFGTLMKKIVNRERVVFLILSYRDKTHERFNEQKKVITFLLNNYKNDFRFYWYNYPDLDFYKYENEIRKTIEDIVMFEQIDKVFTHNYDDTHRDHRVTTQAVIDACRKKSIFFYESPTSRNFIPNHYEILNLSQINKKIKMMDFHVSQLVRNSEYYKDKILSMAKFRGLEIYKEYAEAFTIYRNIE